MSELDRLKRIVKSHLGRVRLRRTRDYSRDDARMILTDLATQMRPEVYNHLVDSSFIREDFLQSIYAAESELGMDLVEDHLQFSADANARVVEEDGRVAITVKPKREEYIIAEYKLPEELGD